MCPRLFISRLTSGKRSNVGTLNAWKGCTSTITLPSSSASIGCIAYVEKGVGRIARWCSRWTCWNSQRPWSTRWIA